MLLGIFFWKIKRKNDHLLLSLFSARELFPWQSPAQPRASAARPSSRARQPPTPPRALPLTPGPACRRRLHPARLGTARPGRNRRPRTASWERAPPLAPGRFKSAPSPSPPLPAASTPHFSIHLRARKLQPPPRRSPEIRRPPLHGLSPSGIAVPFLPRGEHPPASLYLPVSLFLVFLASQALAASSASHGRRPWRPPC